MVSLLTVLESQAVPAIDETIGAIINLASSDANEWVSQFASVLAAVHPHRDSALKSCPEDTRSQLTQSWKKSIDLSNQFVRGGIILN